MATPIQLKLTDYIYKTHAQPTKGLDYKPIKEGLEKWQAKKEAATKSVYDITADLGARSFEAIKGDLDAIWDKINSGEFKVNSPDFMSSKAKIASLTKDLKDSDGFVNSITESLTEDPSSGVVLQLDDKGNLVNVGLDGWTTGITNASERKGGNVQDVIRTNAELMSGYQKAVDQQKMYTEIHKDMGKYFTEMIESNGVTGDDVETIRLGLGRGMYNIRQVITKEQEAQIKSRIKKENNAGLQQKAAIDRATGVNTEATNEEYIDKLIEELIPKGKTTTKEFSLPSQGGTATERKAVVTRAKEVEASKDVKADVNKAQKSGDPTSINKYLRGGGFEIKATKGGMWNVYEIGKTEKGDRVIASINPNESNEIYDAIAENNPNISREGIDAHSFTAAEGDETPSQREARVKVEKQERNLDAVLNSLGSPEGNDLSDDSSNIDVQKRFLDGIGVTYTQNDRDDSIMTITVDGVEFDMNDSDEATKANTAIKKKLRGKSSAGVGSKYN